MRDKTHVAHQFVPDLEQEAIIEDLVIVTIIVITLLLGPLQDLHEVDLLEPLVLHLMLIIHHLVNGRSILVFGIHMLGQFLSVLMYPLPELLRLLPRCPREYSPLFLQ